MTTIKAMRSINTNTVWAILVVGGLWTVGGCASTHVTIHGDGDPWDLKNTTCESFKVTSSANEQSKEGVRGLERCRYPDAARCFEAAVAVDPGDHKSHFGLGAAYELMGQKDKALKAYERAVELAPGERAYREQYDRLKDAVEGQAPLAADDALVKNPNSQETKGNTTQ